MTSAALGTVLQAIFLLACVATACKLLITGLYKRYPIFFLYFLFRIPVTVWLFFADVRSLSYFNIWKAVTGIALAFYVLLVVELYRLVLEKYRGLQTVGRWAMGASLVLSVSLSVLSLLPKMTSMSSQARSYRLILVTERGVDTALALFIILLLAFLSRYPIKLSRNVRLHAMVYSAYFLSNTTSLLLMGLFGVPLNETTNLILSTINTFSVFAWLLYLSPAGEQVPVVQERLGGEHERRLLTQLEALNTAVLRVSRH